MEEELKEVWTTLIRPGKDYGYTDKSKKALRNVTEVYNDLSEYKPKYIPDEHYLVRVKNKIVNLTI